MVGAIVSDIHLKLRRHKEFELNRFHMLIDTLVDANYDFIIINGDLLNHAIPTLHEIKETTRALGKLCNVSKVYLIAGNHEAVSKDVSTYDFLTYPNVHYIDSIENIDLDGVSTVLCPWNSIHKLKLADNADLLISHYRSAMPGLYDEEVDTSQFISKFATILLGDIHSRYSPEPHIHYTGPPYGIHFQKTATEPFGYVKVDCTKGKFKWRYVTLDLPRKLRIDVEASKVGDLQMKPEHLYTVHVTGTLDALKGIKSHDNVVFQKYIDVRAEPSDEPKRVLKDEPFIDALTRIVVEQLVTATAAQKAQTKNILNKLKGDT